MSDVGSHGRTRVRCPGPVPHDELLRLAFAASATGLLVVDAERRIRIANPAAEALLGSGPRELEGADAAALIPDLPSPGPACQAATVEQVGSLRRLELPRRHGGTVSVEVALSVASLGAESLLVVSICAAAADISFHVRAQRSAAFERVMADIAASFVNVPADQVDARIVDGLHQTARVLGAERCVLWQPADDTASGDFIATHYWTDDTWPLTASPASVTAAQHFPWLFSALRQGKIMSFDCIDQIPSETDRASFARFGTRAHLSVPLLAEGRRGLLVLGASRETHWDPYAVEWLPFLGTTFSNAIALRKSRLALDAALVELQRVRDRLQVENVQLRNEVKALRLPRRIVTDSAVAQQVVAQVEQVAPMPVTVLLLGETGSGKEVFAEAIHELSPRRQKPMVRVNCAAIPSALIESELFGRERGAYTGALARQLGRFEVADGSTIFLDEIGDLPPDTQVKLLRVLEERVVERLGNPQPIKVNVRVIAATHIDLEKAVAAGRFREDLYYRLNVFPVRIPPLRERSEDIPALVWAFVNEFSTAFGKHVESISKESLQALQAYSWPGNVRELRNVIERALVIANGPHLVIDLPKPNPVSRRRSLKLVEIEVDHILAVLESTGWRIRGAGGAAELLGMKPTTLESRMARLGIARHGRTSGAAS